MIPLQLKVKILHLKIQTNYYLMKVFRALLQIPHLVLETPFSFQFQENNLFIPSKLFRLPRRNSFLLIRFLNLALSPANQRIHNQIWWRIPNRMQLKISSKNPNLANLKKIKWLLHIFQANLNQWLPCQSCNQLSLRNDLLLQRKWENSFNNLKKI